MSGSILFSLIKDSIAAQLLGLDPGASVIFANAVAGSYIRTGRSPQLKNVIDFLEAEKEALK